MQFTKKLPKLLAGFAAGAFVVSMIGTQTSLSLVSKAQAQATDEIIVTARKRSESIQDVPISVTALSAAQLSKGNIDKVQELGRLTPNVAMHDMDYAGAGLSASIRGVNYDDTEKSNDPAVGVSVDGVFAANNGGVNLDMFDIEAVEVLRGPQGTLFGRNTIGGVINIKRTKPTRELGAKFQVGVEEDSTQILQTVVNFPLGEKAGLKIAARQMEADNWMYNVTNQRHEPYKDTESYHISLDFDLSDNVTVNMIYDNIDDQSRRNNLAINTTDNVFCALGLSCQETSYLASLSNDLTTVYNSNPFIMTYETENLTLLVDAELDNHTLKSITGSQESEELFDIASWGADTVLFPVVRDITFEQFSQEFQLISNNDGPLNYILGAYYMNSEFDQESGPIQNFVAAQEQTVKALFGELDYVINDEWTAILGLRYTEEEKDFFNRGFLSFADKEAYVNSGTAPTAFSNEVDQVYEEDFLQHRFILERNFDAGMAFLSISNGFRSGGIFARCTDPATCAPFGTEEVTNIEAGLKLEPSDNLTFNINAFIADYEDKQEQITTAGGECGLAADVTCTFSLNAAEVSMSGIEIESKYYPSNNLSLNAALGILDAEYDSYDDGGVDISDRAQLRMAPEYTFSFGVDYDVELSRGDLALSATFSGRDKYYGQANYKTYNPVTGPINIVEEIEQLDISATFRTETANGNVLKITAFGNDILEDGGRISRTFDAGAFAFAATKKRQHFGMKIGYEF